MEATPTPDQELDWRLAGVEQRLDAISERLGRLEALLRDTVGSEVHEATTELRRAISELGRRLVQDLPTVLARHRDSIVAELRPPPPPVTAPEPATEPATEAGATEASAAVEGDAEVDNTESDTPEAAERRRAARRRRRQG